MKNIFFNNNLNHIESISLIFFLFFPISILLGNLSINLNIFLISLLFLIAIIFKKTEFNYNNKLFILLLLFFTSLIINLIFSDNYLASLPRIVKIFFIIFFIFSFKNLIKNNFCENLIFKFWSLVFAIVIIDLIIEFYSGENIFGFKSFAGHIRLGSFTGNESNIGNYFYGFALIFLCFIYKKYPEQKLFNIGLAFFLVLISFLIGERSNFIKTFFIIILFSLFVYDIKFKFKIFSIILTICLAILFLNFNENYKGRYFKQVSSIFAKDGISKYLDNSIYGAHYSVATEIFKDNPVFGVGIKNFRVESFKKKYDNIDHKQNHLRGNTHPHQIHYEFLSETGLFGYFSFLIFILFSLYYSIKNYINTKNMFQLSGILFVISSLIPLIPSGSFFSTYPSSIFWINYALMMSYINFKK